MYIKGINSNGGGGSATASGTSFDNTTAQLPNNPDNVQNAIEEIGTVKDLSSSVVPVNISTTTINSVIKVGRIVIVSIQINYSNNTRARNLVASGYPKPLNSVFFPTRKGDGATCYFEIASDGCLYSYWNEVATSPFEYNGFCAYVCE